MDHFAIEPYTFLWPFSGPCIHCEANFGVAIDREQTLVSGFGVQNWAPGVSRRVLGLFISVVDIFSITPQSTGATV